MSIHLLINVQLLLPSHEICYKVISHYYILTHPNPFVTQLYEYSLHY